jgi:protein phosphatase
MRFTIFQDSAIGARAINQDRMGYCFTSESLLMLVADGMGGHPRGEVAAQVALQVCAERFRQQATPRLHEPKQFLEAALIAAHNELAAYQQAHDLPDAPRTTVVACVLQDECVWWAHAGDSRLYWLRDNRVLARTRDHSKVGMLVALGALAVEDEAMHPERNKVLNCLGSPRPPSIEIALGAPLKRGDILLLCTDGVWSGAGDDELVESFRVHTVPAAVPEIVARSVARNGRHADNATALALRWEGGDDEDVPSLSALGAEGSGLTSTIAVPASTDSLVDAALTDEEIERQIAEIREAIEKTQPVRHGEPR